MLPVSSAIAAPPVGAAKAKPVAPKPAVNKPAVVKPVAPLLVALEVTPSTVRLVGAHAEQGLVVTGKFADGSRRDLTATATLRAEPVGVVSLVKDESRRVVRPATDGNATVVVTAPGAPPVTARVEVADAKKIAPISFRHDVVPALTKAGCSQGTCHGTPTG
jgi:hypothetical protein